MNLARRHFNGFLAATILSTATQSVAQAQPKPQQTMRENEKQVIQQMVDAGYVDFLLLNKQNSKLYIIQNGDFFLEAPVVIGRGIGHKVTPTGIFSLRNVFQGATKPEMVFHIDDTGAYLLHEIVKGREWALRSAKIEARQLSDGCVNIDPSVLPYFLGFARQKAEANMNGLATPLVVMDKQHDSAKFKHALTGYIPLYYNRDYLLT